MNRSGHSFSLGMAVMTLGVASVSWSQDAAEAVLAPSGVLHVSRAGALLATTDLNAHGPKWTHASQKDARAKASDAADTGKRLAGVLTIPNTDGGTIAYTQTVTPLSQGFRLEYDLTMTKTMKLNGLQLSVNVPVDKYAGGEVLVSEIHDDMPDLVGLPQEHQRGRFRLWSGQGAKIEIAKETPDQITLELRAATHVVVQDLRQWDQQIFEVRFPAIMEETGREVAEGDRFHLDLTITVPTPVQLKAP